MKKRPNGFLAEDKTDQDGEMFDYIRELHGYLHEFCGGGHGHLDNYLDKSLEKYKQDMVELRAYRRVFEFMENQNILLRDQMINYKLRKAFSFPQT